MNVNAPAVRASLGKYLTFKLQTESYGIDVRKVREIIRHTAITSLPQMPPHICGVLNLRGKIIPVMDLRKRFELAGPTDGAQTCIIVVQVKLSDTKMAQIGLVVDAVEEVVSLSGEEIEPTPDFGGRISTAYIIGMAKVKGEVKTLLDIESIVAAGT